MFLFCNLGWNLAVTIWENGHGINYFVKRTINLTKCLVHRHKTLSEMELYAKSFMSFIFHESTAEQGDCCVIKLKQLMVLKTYHFCKLSRHDCSLSSSHTHSPAALYFAAEATFSLNIWPWLLCANSVLTCLFNTESLVDDK